jgi:hypothetical protein
MVKYIIEVADETQKQPGEDGWEREASPFGPKELFIRWDHLLPEGDAEMGGCAKRRKHDD